MGVALVYVKVLALGKLGIAQYCFRLTPQDNNPSG